jgi:hypothetical protein
MKKIEDGLDGGVLIEFAKGRHDMVPLVGAEPPFLEFH